MEKNVRLRILLVMELLFEKTDAEHGVSMHDILDWIEEYGISGERKSIYEDIHALQRYGLNIEYNSEDKTYRLTERQMQTSELKMIMHAVEEAEFISEENSEIIKEHLMSYTSCYQRNELMDN